MEKRLFLAVFLSLLVVFMFQTVFGTKNNTSIKTQPLSEEHVRSEKTDLTSKDSPAVETAMAASLFEEKSFSIENRIYKIDLTNKGGNINKIYLKAFEQELPVKNPASFNVFENERFDLDQVNDGTIALVFKDADWVVNKEISINSNYTINIKFNIRNNSSKTKSFLDSKIDMLVDVVSLDKNNVQSDHMLYEYSIKTDKKILRKDNARNFNEKWNKEESLNVEWVAFRDKYFVTLIKPEQSQPDYFIETVTQNELLIGSKGQKLVLEPGEEASFGFKMYAGPQSLDLLSKADKEYAKVMVYSNWGWLDAISKAIYWLLGEIHKVMPIWGLCIIVISLIVYGLMYPLTIKSLVSMKKLQALQPKMKEIQEKYKSNPERLNKEVVELYRVHQVNPLGGCLPMLLQMPIFVALYQVLWRTIYFKGESFLWIKDLSLPDRTFKLPVTIPFLGEYVNVLPIIMVGIMAVQQNLNMKSMAAGTPDQAAQQKMMAILLPILIGFIFYNMASGLNLYFVVFYILSTVSQLHIAYLTPNTAELATNSKASR